MSERDGSKIRLINSTQRHVSIGRTGTGKTVAGLYVLSNFDLEDPWIILNFKDDEHIESIKNTRYINWDYVPGPRDHGLFVMNVRPGDCQGTIKTRSNLDVYLEKIWQRQNCGIFVDEARMIGFNNSFDMCLTQGRSRRIPMIVCTQKPSWCSTFVFSEATIIQVFDLNDYNDVKRVMQFVPVDWDEVQPLKKHQSFYYEVSEDMLFRLNPTPDMDEIRDRFAERLHPYRARI